MYLEVKKSEWNTPKNLEGEEATKANVANKLEATGKKGVY